MIFTQFASKELGCTVVKEHRFHPNRKWRFDYAIPERMIALEVEGGVHTAGRHIRPIGFLNDMEKYNAAGMMGWRVLRCTPSSLLTMATVDMIRQAMETTTASESEVDYIERHRLCCPFLHGKNLCVFGAANIQRQCDQGCEYMKRYIK